MIIHKIISQSRRDFTAVYKCEHCGREKEGYGYDDTNFHCNVIPKMICPNCKKTAGDTYEPEATKYKDWEVV